MFTCTLDTIHTTRCSHCKLTFWCDLIVVQMTWIIRQLAVSDVMVRCWPDVSSSLDLVNTRNVITRNNVHRSLPPTTLHWAHTDTTSTITSTARRTTTMYNDGLRHGRDETIAHCTVAWPCLILSRTETNTKRSRVGYFDYRNLHNSIMLDLPTSKIK